MIVWEHVPNAIIAPCYLLVNEYVHFTFFPNFQEECILLKGFFPIFLKFNIEVIVWEHAANAIGTPRYLQGEHA